MKKIFQLGKRRLTGLKIGRINEKVGLFHFKMCFASVDHQYKIQEKNTS